MKDQSAAARKPNGSFGQGFESWQSGSRNRKTRWAQALNVHHSNKVDGVKIAAYNLLNPELLKNVFEKCYKSMNKWKKEIMNAMRNILIKS